VVAAEWPSKNGREKMAVGERKGNIIDKEIKDRL